MNDNTRHHTAPDEPDLTRLYHESATEEPPSALDAAIRAAARREAALRPRQALTPFSRNWKVQASLAAVLALGVGLVSVMRESRPPQDDLPVSAAPPAPPAEASVSAKKEVLDERARFASQLADVPSSAGNSSALRFDSEVSTASTSLERVEREQKAVRPQAPAPVASQGAAVAARKGHDEDRAAGGLFRELVRLLDEGRDEEALAMWKRLQEERPDFAVDEKTRQRIRELESVSESR